MKKVMTAFFNYKSNTVTFFCERDDEDVWACICAGLGDLLPYASLHEYEYLVRTLVKVYLI